MQRSNNKNFTIPNLLIAGFQRCGTTALSEYLKTHPDISVTEPKEPHYFAPEFSGVCPAENYEEYLRQKFDLVYNEVSKRTDQESDPKSFVNYFIEMMYVLSINKESYLEALAV